MKAGRDVSGMIESVYYLSNDLIASGKGSSCIFLRTWVYTVDITLLTLLTYYIHWYIVFCYYVDVLTLNKSTGRLTLEWKMDKGH